MMLFCKKGLGKLAFNYYYHWINNIIWNLTVLDINNM